MSDIKKTNQDTINLKSGERRHATVLFSDMKGFTGLSEKMGGAGDPSPFTAYGVYMGMKACAKEAYGNDSLENKKVAVQGVGHVGHFLVKHLIKEGANVIVSDIYEDKIKEVSDEFKVEVIDEN